MIALLDLLQTEKQVIRRIENAESLIQKRREAIEVYRSSNASLAPLLANESYEAISKLYTDIEANKLILKAVRNEIRMYFEDLKEEAE